VTLSFDTYQALALRTENPGRPFDKRLDNAALGLAGEGGEVADIVKKYLHQGHELDRTALLEEACDVLWYLALLTDILGVTLSEIAQMNIVKLQSRYPEGFDAERSINRE